MRVVGSVRCCETRQLHMRVCTMKNSFLNVVSNRTETSTIRTNTHTRCTYLCSSIVGISQSTEPLLASCVPKEMTHTAGPTDNFSYTGFHAVSPANVFLLSFGHIYARPNKNYVDCYLPQPNDKRQTQAGWLAYNRGKMFLQVLKYTTGICFFSDFNMTVLSQ